MQIYASWRDCQQLLIFFLWINKNFFHARILLYYISSFKKLRGWTWILRLSFPELSKDESYLLQSIASLFHFYYQLTYKRFQESSCVDIDTLSSVWYKEILVFSILSGEKIATIFVCVKFIANWNLFMESFWSRCWTPDHLSFIKNTSKVVPSTVKHYGTICCGKIDERGIGVNFCSIVTAELVPQVNIVRVFG